MTVSPFFVQSADSVGPRASRSTRPSKMRCDIDEEDTTLQTLRDARHKDHSTRSPRFLCLYYVCKKRHSGLGYSLLFATGWRVWNEPGRQVPMLVGRSLSKQDVKMCSHHAQREATFWYQGYEGIFGMFYVRRSSIKNTSDGGRQTLFFSI